MENNGLMILSKYDATKSSTKIETTKGTKLKERDKSRKEVIKFKTDRCLVSHNNGFSTERMLVITNFGFYIMQKSSKKTCKYCPSENFCPEGPVIESCHSFESIDYIESAKKDSSNSQKHTIIISIESTKGTRRTRTRTKLPTTENETSNSTIFSYLTCFSRVDANYLSEEDGESDQYSISFNVGGKSSDHKSRPIKIKETVMSEIKMNMKRKNQF